MKKILLPAFVLISAAASAQCTQLFFSEYLEGSSNNKAIEIYNPSNTTVNLTDYKIMRANNGSPLWQDSLFPQGTLGPGMTYVAGNPSAVASILAVSDTLHTITFFNGDDCMGLIYIPTNTMIDQIGQLGVDPGTNWPVGTGATSEFTLVRMTGIQQGNVNWTAAASEYLVYAQNTDTTLGHHFMTPCCTPPSIQLLTLNQVACNGGSDGVIQILGSGTGTLTFEWIGRPETTPYLTGIPAGTYTAVVTGACGTDTMSFTITEPTPLVVNLDSIVPSGCTVSNGSIWITPGGSVAPYTYLWSNGQTTQTATGLSSGVYTCTVTCANGCSAISGPFQVNNTAPPAVAVSLNIDTACTSSASVVLSGGSPSGGLYSGVDVAGDSTFVPATIGWSVVTYTYVDVNGCSASATDSIWVDACLSIDAPGTTGFSISPNPFTDVVVMQFAGADNAVSVYNVQGQLVHKENVPGNVARISLITLPVGVYTIQVVNENGVMTKKVQKVD